MPRYELMYILASSVSDDIVPQTSKEVEQFVTDFGGTDIQHEQLGKKKLAYAIKKTRNGHYGVIAFSMPGAKVKDLEAKLRTQKNTIIRYIIVNMDEHLERLEKDKEVQAKMNKSRDPERVAQAAAAEEKAAQANGNGNTASPAPAPAAPAKKREPKPVAPVSNEQLDEEIEKALSEDIA